MKAKLIYNKHETRADGVRLELVIWRNRGQTTVSVSYIEINGEINGVSLD